MLDFWDERSKFYTSRPSISFNLHGFSFIILHIFQCHFCVVPLTVKLCSVTEFRIFLLVKILEKVLEDESRKARNASVLGQKKVYYKKVLY